MAIEVDSKNQSHCASPSLLFSYLPVLLSSSVVLFRCDLMSMLADFSFTLCALCTYIKNTVSLLNFLITPI
ncbi:unnamed protein product, partial [Hymenolepis diminuta]